MKTKKILSLMIAVVFVLSLSVTAFADISPLSDPNIVGMSGSITKAGNGKVNINFSIVAKDTMVTLGAKSIDLYKSNGSYVTTLYSSIYDNMLGSNAAWYSSSVPYSAESGQTYYAIITFFADSGSVSSTDTYTTASVTA